MRYAPLPVNVLVDARHEKLHDDGTHRLVRAVRVKPEPAGDLVDLVASGAVQRDQDKPFKVLHCKLCGKRGVTARTHASGHQQTYRHVKK